jgi:hypothetical protein
MIQKDKSVSDGRKIIFLDGELEEQFYIEQPEGFLLSGKEDYVCRLKRYLYGLKQALRA